MVMYYDQVIQALTGAFAIHTFTVPLDNLDIINDGGADLSWSYDGTNEAGRLAAGQSKCISMAGAAAIYIKGTAGQSYKLNAEARMGM